MYRTGIWPTFPVAPMSAARNIALNRLQFKTHTNAVRYEGHGMNDAIEESNELLWERYVSLRNRSCK